MVDLRATDIRPLWQALASDVPLRCGTLTSDASLSKLLIQRPDLARNALVNASAAAIWELATGERTVGEIAAELDAWLGGAGVVRTTDVCLAVGQLAELRLLEILSPSSAEALYERGKSSLQKGSFGSGWDECESRFVARRNPRFLPQRLWRGESLTERSILVHREQGIGDEILYASCFPEILASAERCVLTCDERLLPLFGRSFPGATLIGEPPGMHEWLDHRHLEVDYQIAAASVPRYLRRAAADFPDRFAYLREDEARRSAWSQRLANLGSGLKVGLCWRGGQRGERELPWEPLRQLLGLDGVQFVCLQYGDRDTIVRSAREEAGVTILDWPESDNYSDLDDLAAKIAALDAVVAVPGAAAHMAGALGRPLLIPFAPDWGCWWITCGKRALWYPTSRVYSSEPEGWAGVVSSIRLDLVEITARLNNSTSGCLSS